MVAAYQAALGFAWDRFHAPLQETSVGVPSQYQASEVASSSERVSKGVKSS